MPSRLIVDTGPLLAPARPTDPLTRRVAEILRAEGQQPVMPAPVAAELDYMLTARRGIHGNAAFLRDLAEGRFEVANLEPSDYATIHWLNQRYYDLGAGLTDLSVVAVAARYRTTRILTFDQRHFRTLTPLQGSTFVLVPYDEAPGRT